MLAPGPSVWKETRSPEDGCAEGADPHYQAHTTPAWLGNAPALELLQAGPARLRVTGAG